MSSTLFSWPSDRTYDVLCDSDSQILVHRVQHGIASLETHVLRPHLTRCIRMSGVAQPPVFQQG